MNHAIVPPNSRSAVLAIASTLILSGCTSKANPTNMSQSQPMISLQHLESISKKKIFFGHQSVGYNIVDGVGDVLKQYPAVTLNVTESREPEVFAAPVLAHATVGRNSDPESKINDFAERIRAGIGNRADVAAFKFCYVDVDHNTNVSQVFAKYKRTMTDLAAAYPNTRFMHVTVPLKATSTGWKKYVKSILGKPHPFIMDNLRRQEFNELMRREYAGRQPFFDLAAVEATRADGSVSFDTSNGAQIPSMANEYTYDSGHLNEQGRKFVAAQFLRALASL
jgi:hypothetical protein